MSHLYKKFVNERVVNLINDRERIRNCTVIAHIDHGKTTLTDSLIAASGLMSSKIAASARMMDYDLIEQERGITIKASGISLVHEFESKEHLVHLVDTPGHIDFSSHVTRGLRLTDGAIVVIDVIEGLMVQTETVTRQAMAERVRPVLFINKVDRLVTERRLQARKVAEEVNKVAREFNAMLGKYLEDEILEKWEVSFPKNSLSIGSALDKWAIGLETLKARADESDAESLADVFMELMEEVVDSYRNETEEELEEKFPIAEVVLDSVVKTVPNPIDAQQYRIPAFWDGDLQSDSGKSLMNCDPNGPCILLVSDVQPDRHAGTVATVRVFSGVLRRGEPLLTRRTRKKDKSLQVGVYMSKTRVALDEVPAGNLAFITGIKDVSISDTLVSPNIAELEPMIALQYPTEPVVTYTIEPRRLAELSEIQEPIQEFVSTDPTLEFELNPETGEMLLSGAGELHVEIAVEKLTRLGVHLRLGTPMVVLKEQLTARAKTAQGGSEDTSRFWVKANLIENDALEDVKGTVIEKDEQAQCYLVDTTGTIDPYSDIAEWVKEGFRIVTRNGPVQGERMRMLLASIQKAKLKVESPETSWRDVTQPLVEALRNSIMSDDPVVMEPWTRLEITAPEDYVGILTSILARRKGQVLKIDSEKALYRIEAEIPVRESFGLANEMRTETSGWVTWGAKPTQYRPVGSKPYEEF